MKRLVLFATAFACLAAAQRPPLDSPLLDHLVGRWTLQGTIAGKQTTHDVTGRWVANHQYLQLHDVSRETIAGGRPQYDALIHIGWDPQTQTYSIIWLDNFWGIGPEAIGAASSKDNVLPFVWKDEKGAVTFSNEFVYDPKSDSWQWIMDNVVNGQHKPFGRVKLTRAAAAESADK